MSRILLFDSGIGGLSIYHELKTTLPHCEYYYYADHEAAPYGTKNDSWLNKRINQYLIALDQVINPDIIIIACNTASTLSLDSLRSKIKTHIIGVVPAIKTASENQTSSNIGLLATPATINRRYIDMLIKDFGKDNTFIKIGNTKLVDMAEQKLSGRPPCLTDLISIITPFIKENCQQVILGCTHFPLLKKELQLIAPDINWIDSGTAIAKRAQSILINENTKLEKPVSIFYSSSNINEALKTYVTKIGFGQVIINYIPHSAL